MTAKETSTIVKWLPMVHSLRSHSVSAAALLPEPTMASKSAVGVSRDGEEAVDLAAMVLAPNPILPS